MSKIQTNYQAWTFNFPNWLTIKMQDCQFSCLIQLPGLKDYQGKEFFLHWYWGNWIRLSIFFQGLNLSFFLFYFSLSSVSTMKADVKVLRFFFLILRKNGWR